MKTNETSGGGAHEKPSVYETPIRTKNKRIFLLMSQSVSMEAAAAQQIWRPKVI